MRFLILGFLCLTYGCATRYLIPGNRYLTPESQGEAFRGQAEFQKTTANQLSIDTREGNIDEGVLYEDISRSGFLFSNSLFDQLDLFWSHVSSGNSMLGGKFQFMGGSRHSNSTGHKMAIAAAFGRNEHETEDGVVEFNLGGQEFLFLYGYRFMESVMTYGSISQAAYQFDGRINSDSSLDGLEPKISSRVTSISAGVEGSVKPVFAKLEFTYQTINSDKTKAYSHFITGLSLGVSW